MKLSVVIPAFNEESQLPGCLDSLLAQTRAIDEIIVVDNNSTDRTASVVADYAARHPAVRHEFEPIRGVHAARRRGLDSATSELIAKVDADTRVGPDWAALGVEFLAGPRGREFSALTGPVLLADAPFVGLQKRMAARSYGKLAEGGSIGSVHGPAYILRRAAWRQIRHRLHTDEHVWEDLDVGLSMAACGMRVAFDPRLLAETSCRRLRTSPWRNRHYILGGRRTARAHGHTRLAAVMTLDAVVKFAMFTYFWLILRPWDPTTRTWRPHRPLTPLPA
ncbi:glycosyltransferase family 2 protein [Gordonia oryzae]|uniref:4,4'-diaponeurosporenoate glycosyltransferase n=1 Tax=Gordonia oryzae TaxID=2487349 RepID=A0A3N4GEL7_9ACTN|nr:glycosyltransferase family A protein [Gordonia oryzae]RPA61192.1 glycosyltransferase family 2 protein [Gordonia oryzae]